MKIALVAQHAASLAASPAADDLMLGGLTRGLADVGHDVTVYTQAGTAHAGTRRARARKAPEGSQPRARVRTEHIGPPVGRSEQELLAGVGGFADALRERLEDDQPDVLHAVRWTSGLAALAATRGARVPLVQSFVSLGVAEHRQRVLTPNASPQRARLEPAIGRNAAAVIAATEQEQADLTRIGVPRRSSTVIPRGVDTAMFTPDGPAASRSDRPRMIAITDLDAYDEIKLLLRVLSRVPDAELVVAGGPAHDQLADDPAHRKLAAEAHSLGVADRVIFTGSVRRNALPPLLRSADVLVSAAEYEPTGAVAVEAMACGTPVAAFATGGQADAVIDGTTGVLIQPGRPAQFAQRLRQLLASPMQLAAYSVAAADRAQSRYSWDRIACETAKLYDLVAASASGTLAA
ncbi:MAG TPA: glycosyltransferase [Trebonia sp.]|jgi:glycosyltransferase involved in cell wall biosynthesis